MLSILLLMLASLIFFECVAWSIVIFPKVVETTISKQKGFVFSGFAQLELMLVFFTNKLVDEFVKSWQLILSNYRLNKTFKTCS
jgi:hypothetical protein